MSNNTPQSSIIIDIDGTLCPLKKDGQSYADLAVDPEMVATIESYQKKGFRIVLYTARNMRTYGGNLGLINRYTAPELLDWLDRHNVPFDEILFGKPWPGPDGFYVDDRTVRPDEFKNLTQDELAAITQKAAVTPS